MVKLVKIVTHFNNRKRAAELFEEEGVISISWAQNESIFGKSKEEIKQQINTIID